MTVAELIRELQAIPFQGARIEIVLTRAYVAAPKLGMVFGYLEDSDSLEADEVRNMGAFVLIRSK